MTLLLISFIAGVLTVLAPCVLPLLPVVVGSAASGRSKATPYIVVGSLSVSIILFTYLLKFSSVFIRVPPEFWTYLSGGILTLFGLTLLFPGLWEHIPGLNKLSVGSNKLLGTGFQKHSLVGDIIVGASLGPVFSTCSPTYFVILASVLPASFALGTVYLLAYTLGLAIFLLLIAVIGERFVSRLSGLSDPKGWFKRTIGVIFILLGLMIMLGYEKKLETAILNSGYLDVTKLEQGLLKKLDDDKKIATSTTDSGEASDSLISDISTTTWKVADVKLPAKVLPKKSGKNSGPRYIEIAKPAGFVNTGELPTGSTAAKGSLGGNPIKIGDYVGKNVILLDFMTYSCINCQRTFPYINSWYEKYKDKGLTVIGIHTPEFAFEKDRGNVIEGLHKFGIQFPIVMDNNYGTWNAFGNNYWPRKYLIDIYGNIVYDHAGEGSYDEIEMKIRELLDERSEVLGGNSKVSGIPLASTYIDVANNPAAGSVGSPETYFGSARNGNFGSGTAGVSGVQSFVLPDEINPNTLYFGGMWNLMPEYAESSSGGSVAYYYSAQDVYLVASVDSVDGVVGEKAQSGEIEVWQDGVKLDNTKAGAGADVDSSGIVRVKESRLYKIIHNDKPGQHILQLKIKGAGIKMYTFTFG